MVRQKLLDRIGQEDFRWRGKEVGRVEGFSDAVFAFAVTLLVVSLEVPRTFDELMVTMRGFFAFAICFAFLLGIWYAHFNFFRRYGLINSYTTFLNAVLMFLVLFYVYPLKFLFTWLVAQVMGITSVKLADGSVVRVIENADTPTLMVIYSLGYVAVFLIFTLLYQHAYSRRDVLELTPVEIHITREFLQRNIIFCTIGLLSIASATLLPINYIGFAGLIYWLIGPVVAIHANYKHRQRKKMALADSASESKPPGVVNA